MIDSILLHVGTRIIGFVLKKNGFNSNHNHDLDLYGFVTSALHCFQIWSFNLHLTNLAFYFDHDQKSNLVWLTWDSIF